MTKKPLAGEAFCVFEKKPRGAKKTMTNYELYIQGWMTHFLPQKVLQPQKK